MIDPEVNTLINAAGPVWEQRRYLCLGIFVYFLFSIGYLSSITAYTGQISIFTRKVMMRKDSWVRIFHPGIRLSQNRNLTG